MFIFLQSVVNNKLLLQIFNNRMRGKWLFLCFFLSSSTPGALYLQGYSLVCIAVFALLTSERSHIFIVHACCEQLVFELVLELVLEVFCLFFIAVDFCFDSSDLFFCFFSPFCGFQSEKCYPCATANRETVI